MNTWYPAALALAIAVTGPGCSGEPENLSARGDYIVFGDFYGECFGDGCIDIFKVAQKRVFEDTLDLYPSASSLPHMVEFVQVANGRYDDIIDLIGDIPAHLFDVKGVVIGQPDAGDWGGFYLETNTSGEVRYWLIDKLEENLPTYLREYTRNLDAAIQIASE